MAIQILNTVIILASCLSFYILFFSLKHTVRVLECALRVLTEGSCSPAHKIIAYRILAERKVCSSKDIIEYYKDIQKETYTKCLNNLEAVIACSEDPNMKDHFIKVSEELKTTFMLMDSVDENSTEEYRKQIFFNVQNSIDKLMHGEI